MAVGVSAMIRKLVGTGVLLAIVGIGGTASGATIYSYTGNVFDTIVDNTQPDGTYTSSMSITGFFEHSPIAPNQTSLDISGSLVDFSFNDGRRTRNLTNTDTIVDFLVSTDSSGNLSNWDIRLESGAATSLGQQVHRLIIGVSTLDRGQIEECISEDAGGSCFVFSSDLAQQTSQGTWTVIPIPAALPLMGAGLAVLGFLGWRRRKAA